MSLTGPLCMTLYQIHGENCPINVALACGIIKVTSYLLFFIILRNTKSPNCDVCMSRFVPLSFLKNLLMWRTMPCVPCVQGWVPLLLALHWHQLTNRGNLLFLFSLFPPFLMGSFDSVQWELVGSQTIFKADYTFSHLIPWNALYLGKLNLLPYSIRISSHSICIRLLRCFWRDFHYL